MTVVCRYLLDWVEMAMCASVASMKQTSDSTIQISSDIFRDVLKQMKTTAGGPDQILGSHTLDTLQAAHNGMMQIFQAAVCLMNEVHIMAEILFFFVYFRSE